MPSEIQIKPHHFVDILTSFGAGQRTFEPHPYGHAVHSVSQQILDDPEVVLQIELGIDTICKPCVHNKDGMCDDTIDTSHRPNAPSAKNAWNLMIDQRWCQRLQLEPGDQLTAGLFCQRIRDRMGDITDIYREIAASATQERHAKLAKGIAYYLDASRIK